MSKEYYYYDAKDGTPYCPHTCTDADADTDQRKSGAEYRNAVMDGGDVTTVAKKVLPIGAIGSGYYNGREYLALKANGSR